MKTCLNCDHCDPFKPIGYIYCRLKRVKLNETIRNCPDYENTWSDPREK